MTCDVPDEELAALAVGDLEPDRQDELGEHITGCAACQGRLDAIRRADDALAGVAPIRPPASALLTVRRALVEATRGAAKREVMTLDEVATFLRLDPDELDRIVEALPVFELAGRLRVRRSKLLEWIEGRERAHARSVAAAWVADARARASAKGVA